jgi:hypothetical protein
VVFHLPRRTALNLGASDTVFLLFHSVQIGKNDSPWVWEVAFSGSYSYSYYTYFYFMMAWNVILLHSRWSCHLNISMITRLKRCYARLKDGIQLA